MIVHTRKKGKGPVIGDKGAWQCPGEKEKRVVDKGHGGGAAEGA